MRMSLLRSAAGATETGHGASEPVAAEAGHSVEDREAVQSEQVVPVPAAVVLAVAAVPSVIPASIASFRFGDHRYRDE